MYTTCPDCSSVYSITTEELGAAGGLVRCGNCDATFSAIRRLSEEAPQPSTTREPHGGQSATSTDIKSTALDSGELPPEESATGAVLRDETPGDESFSNEEEPAVDEDFDQEVAVAIEQGDDDDSSDEAAIDHDEAERVSPGDAAELSRLDEGPMFEEPDKLAEKLIEEIDLLDELDSPSDEFFEADLAIDGDDDLLAEFDDDEDLEFIDAEVESDEDAEIENDAETDVGSAQAENDDTVGDAPHEDKDSDETAKSTLTASEDADRETPGEPDETAEAGYDDTDGDAPDEHQESDEDTEADDEHAGENITDTDANNESSEASDDAQAPDDATFTEKILDDWDTEEGESDLEALMADEDFLSEEDTDAGTGKPGRDDSPATEKQSDADAVESTDADDPESLPRDDDTNDRDTDAVVNGASEEQGSNEQSSEEQGSNEQSSEEQGSDEQSSEEQGSEEQGSEAQDSDEQGSDEQGSDEQDSDAKDSEVRDSDADIEADDSDVSDAEELAAHSDGDAEPDDILIADVDGKFETDANDAHDYRDISHYLTPKKSLGRRIGESFLLLLLATLLGAQYVHHNRKELATHPRVGAHVQKIYSQFGLPLQPDWDVRDYRIARHTIVPQNDDQTVLLARATVINNSAHVRPMPLIRLELKNRWGDVVFARVFSAAEYLPDGSDAQMQGGARLEAVLDVLNPTDDGEIGYSFGICLNQADGRLNCGKDETFRQ